VQATVTGSWGSRCLHYSTVCTFCQEKTQVLGVQKLNFGGPKTEVPARQKLPGERKCSQHFGRTGGLRRLAQGVAPRAFNRPYRCVNEPHSPEQHDGTDHRPRELPADGGSASR